MGSRKRQPAKAKGRLSMKKERKKPGRLSVALARLGEAPRTTPRMGGASAGRKRLKGDEPSDLAQPAQPFMPLMPVCLQWLVNGALGVLDSLYPSEPVLSLMMQRAMLPALPSEFSLLRDGTRARKTGSCRHLGGKIGRLASNKTLGMVQVRCDDGADSSSACFVIWRPSLKISLATFLVVITSGLTLSPAK